MGGRKREKMAKNKTKFTVEEIVKFLRDEEENETVEGQLLRTRFIRELYKQLGDPQEEDFPQEHQIAGRCWSKYRGYTTHINMLTENRMLIDNSVPTYWNIKQASKTKVQIVEEYTRAGWHCEVQSFNVMCTKYVKHPKYENIWVRFYSSRDCNKYEYAIEKK